MTEQAIDADAVANQGFMDAVVNAAEQTIDAGDTETVSARETAPAPEPGSDVAPASPPPPSEEGGETEKSEVAQEPPISEPPAPIEDDPEGNIQKFLANEEWVIAHPQLAKQFEGIQRHLTQKSQTYAEATRKAEAEAEAAKSLTTELQELKNIVSQYDPRNPGPIAQKFIDEKVRLAEREEATHFDTAEFQRLRNDESDYAAEQYRERIEAKKYQFKSEDLAEDKKALTKRVDELESKLALRDHREKILQEEGTIFTKAKEAGLSEDQAVIANLIVGGMRDRQYEPDLDKAFEMVKAMGSTKEPAPKPEKKGNTVAEILAKGKANAAIVSPSSVSAPAQAVSKKAPMVEYQFGDVSAAWVNDVLDEMALKGIK